jgi:hypothetical protein
VSITSVAIVGDLINNLIYTLLTSANRLFPFPLILPRQWVAKRKEQILLVGSIGGSNDSSRMRKIQNFSREGNKEAVSHCI